jgi:4-hydroxy-3-methylbut-2-enyl diphosphate reductase
MTRAVVCAPLVVESLAVRTATRRGEVDVRRTGMGPRRSVRSATRLADRYDAVLVAGLAGGLQPDLMTGDVVVASEVRGENGERVRCPGASELADVVRRCGVVARVGPVACTTRVCRGAERARLAQTGALAVDMESLPLSRMCRAGASYAVLRVVVDTPTAGLLRVGTVGRGILALRRLRAVVPALIEWVQAERAQTEQAQTEWVSTEEAI